MIFDWGTILVPAAVFIAVWWATMLPLIIIWWLRDR